MPFDREYGKTSQTVRIPLRVIEAVYGRDNHDNAGDDIILCLRQAADYRNQHKYSFDFDTTHTNPWYHAHVITINGISEEHYNHLIELLAGYGLRE